MISPVSNIVPMRKDIILQEAYACESTAGALKVLKFSSLVFCNSTGLQFSVHETQPLFFGIHRPVVGKFIFKKIRSFLLFVII
jgi:hypothetical protein